MRRRGIQRRCGARGVRGSAKKGLQGTRLPVLVVLLWALVVPRALPARARQRREAGRGAAGARAAGRGAHGVLAALGGAVFVGDEGHRLPRALASSGGAAAAAERSAGRRAAGARLRESVLAAQDLTHEGVLRGAAAGA
jgi:hypothetical protein